MYVFIAVVPPIRTQHPVHERSRYTHTYTGVGCACGRVREAVYGSGCMYVIRVHGTLGKVRFMYVEREREREREIIIIIIMTIFCTILTILTILTIPPTITIPNYYPLYYSRCQLTTLNLTTHHLDYHNADYFYLHNYYYDYCHQRLFTCNNYRCLPQAIVCDSIDDCGDSSDEMNCGSGSGSGSSSGGGSGSSGSSSSGSDSNGWEIVLVDGPNENSGNVMVSIIFEFFF